MKVLCHLCLLLIGTMMLNSCIDTTSSVDPFQSSGSTSDIADIHGTQLVTTGSPDTDPPVTSMPTTEPPRTEPPVTEPPETTSPVTTEPSETTPSTPDPQYIFNDDLPGHTALDFERPYETISPSKITTVFTPEGENFYMQNIYGMNVEVDLWHRGWGEHPDFWEENDFFDLDYAFGDYPTYREQNAKYSPEWAEENTLVSMIICPSLPSYANYRDRYGEKLSDWEGEYEPCPEVTGVYIQDGVLYVQLKYFDTDTVLPNDYYYHLFIEFPENLLEKVQKAEFFVYNAQY